MGDIIVLNSLQTVVPACGQVQFPGLADGSSVRLIEIHSVSNSVGIVLLDVRYGKWETHVLDNLAYRQADVEVG
jgi:hypothetical protein